MANVLGQIDPNLLLSTISQAIAANPQGGDFGGPGSTAQGPQAGALGTVDDSRQLAPSTPESLAPPNITGGGAPAYGEPGAASNVSYGPPTGVGDKQANDKRASGLGQEEYHKRLGEFSDHERQIEALADPNVLGVINPAKKQELLAQNDAEKIRYMHEHPWGSPESAHPGVLGKVLHGIGTVAETAAPFFGVAPALIPGTQANLGLREGGALGRMEKFGTIGAQEEAATAKETKNIPAEEQAYAAQQRVDQAVASNRVPNPADVVAVQAYGETKKAGEKTTPGTEEEQFIGQYLKDKGLTDTADNRLVAHNIYGGKGPAGQQEASRFTNQIASVLKGTGIDASGYKVDGKQDSSADMRETLAAAQKAVGEKRAQGSAERQANAPTEAENRKNRETSGYALDANGKLVLTNKADALARGVPFEEMKSGDVNTDRKSLRQLNDIQKNVSEYSKAIGDQKTPIEHTAAIKRIVAGINDSDVEKMGYITMGAAGHMMEQSEVVNSWNKLDKGERALVIGYLRAKGAMIAYSKVVSGSARSNKEALAVEWANLPYPDAGSTVGSDQMKSMQENLDQVNQGYPTNLPGMSTPEQVREKIEGNAAPTTPAEAHAAGWVWKDGPQGKGYYPPEGK